MSEGKPVMLAEEGSEAGVNSEGGGEAGWESEDDRDFARVDAKVSVEAAEVSSEGVNSGTLPYMPQQTRSRLPVLCCSVGLHACKECHCQLSSTTLRMPASVATCSAYRASSTDCHDTPILFRDVVIHYIWQKYTIHVYVI